LRTLPFSLPDFEIQQVTAGETTITITAHAISRTATCPSCQQDSHRIHSYYTRSPADLPISGLRVQLVLRVRRFRCSNRQCSRHTFVERLPEVVPLQARRTTRLCVLLDCIACTLSAQAGAHLVKHMGIAVSADTLLRRVKRTSSYSPQTPRILGVDDFALRRGLTYGTILVDLSTHRPIDLLADRSAETFARWLREHPGVEVISRDRAGAYAEGGRLGAPDAVQVADRWHLIRNLADALDVFLRRQAPFQKSSRKASGNQAQKRKPGPPHLRLTPAQHQRREHLHERFRQVQGFYEQGRSLREIAGILEIDTNTLRYFVHSQPWAASESHRGRKAGDANLAPYLPYLHSRWRAGCQNGLQLWRELRARGYTGSASSVKPYVALLRQVPDDLLPPVFSRRATTAKEQSFSARRVIWLALARPENLDKEQAQELSRAYLLHPEVATALNLTQDFIKVLRKRDLTAFSTWLAEAQASSIRELRQFAQGIERDRAAVEAAFIRAESNGQVEGQITKLKLIKRTMYGRAKMPLLRQRVLHAA
jgi:transposase